MAKRRVEVFTAGCPFCEPVVQLVRELACPDCEVTVYDVRETGADTACGYGVTRVPTVVVEGAIAPCCPNGAINGEDFQAVGIGQRLAD